MCGFAGVYRSSSPDHEEVLAEVRRMTAPLVHRGPDDSGFWTDEREALALGFRRLSIVELSPLGHQPMTSASGRFVLVFNGEVYNHHELRRELEGRGHRFQGGSDTEVILGAFEEWGVREAVSRFVGMFAMAVRDREGRQLHLLRDRMGIKPLYLYRKAGVVGFASELKGLMELRGFDRSLDPRSLTAYFRFLYIPAPSTIFTHVRKIPPGVIVTIDDPARLEDREETYWSMERISAEGIGKRTKLSDRELIDQAEALISDAVGLRMRADVPVGAFLSGGIDSSTVVASMQASSTTPVRTYTIGFSEAGFDETAAAERIAKHLGTTHTGMVLSGSDALDLVPAIADIFDEPLADPSQLPTLLVSQLARKEVTVALSGDGGDELFAGYNRYTHGEVLFARALKVPRRPRQLVAAGIRSFSPATWDRVHQAASPVLPSRLRQRLPGDKLHKLGSFLPLEDAAAMYRSVISAWQSPVSLVDGGSEPNNVAEVFGSCARGDTLDRMMLFDQKYYLPDDLLAKVDRASMAVSLEVRVPLLDHRLAAFSWSLAREHRIRNGQGKWILRQVLDRYVPRELIERPKMGFSVPIDTWLRGPLRAWADELLSPRSLAASGALRPEPINAEWRSFLSGQGRAGMGLWAVLMFQAWHQRWMVPA